MKFSENEFYEILSMLDKLIDQSKTFEKKYAAQIEAVHPKYRKSAVNLIHYWSLRQEDIRGLQNKLKKIGLSRLGRAEAHIQASMLTTYSIVQSLVTHRQITTSPSGISIAEGEKLLKKNTKALLGEKTKGRNVRIMVTQPEQAANDPALILAMLHSGMDVARVNCAHDTPEVWSKIIDNVKTASSKLGRESKICMDLGGPKVRTGKISPGPRVKKLRPLKDEFGRVVKAYEFSLVPESRYDPKDIHSVPVSDDFFAKLSPDLQLSLIDTRGKKRVISIGKIEGMLARAAVSKTTFIEAGTKLSFIKGRQHKVGAVGKLPAGEGSIKLYKGDVIHLHKNMIEGKDGLRDKAGKIFEPPAISFTLPEIFYDLKKGEKVLFDDGKIEGVIESINSELAVVKILNASTRGRRLRADKGINFPDSQLNVSGLTQKDREDLEFVVRQADIVNFSFVNTVSDVQDLFDEIKKCTEPEKAPGVILKIETQRGYKNLFDILLKSMQHYPIGVMIARGDLAIECGWESMARVQEEILSLCNAAHIPVIWATQVLENMAKTGLPSRSEITDAATAQRAECVMLNKGPSIVEAIKLLNTILKNMKDYQEKKANMLPAFT